MVLLHYKLHVMLLTNLRHIESEEDHKRAIGENENVVIICGRADQECNAVYGIAKELDQEYSHVKFYDIEFDKPVSQVLRSIPQVQKFEGAPFTVYYKNGKVVRATSGFQTKDQIRSILNEEFSVTVIEDSFNWWW